ncbi:hypothetical protein OH76DRAFT_115273 [Lentinus brumalis]|uniref:Uncharacterized protein n=1 Tax=Lentinus brumalis TaxID=2498619 RepID=A0A371CPZ6_9APHY|nr:hypothetical protein OH76DRAFT_115273 [Polyporus brumalis]
MYRKRRRSVPFQCLYSCFGVFARTPAYFGGVFAKSIVDGSVRRPVLSPPSPIHSCRGASSTRRSLAWGLHSCAPYFSGSSNHVELCCVAANVVGYLSSSARRQARNRTPCRRPEVGWRGI